MLCTDRVRASFLLGKVWTKIPRMVNYWTRGKTRTQLSASRYLLGMGGAIFFLSEGRGTLVVIPDSTLNYLIIVIFSI